MKETKEPGHGEIKTEKFGLGDILDFLTGDKEVNETPSNTDINQNTVFKRPYRYIRASYKNSKSAGYFKTQRKNSHNFRA